MASLLSGMLTGTTTPSTTSSDAVASGTSSTKSLFAKGVMLPWWIHIFITGIAPFLLLVPVVGPGIFAVPYTFGVNGINLLASNSMGWAAAKAATNIMCKIVADVLAAYLPGQWWLPAAKAILYYANPWFVFDILQIYNPNFTKEGYKVPFANIMTSSNIKGNKTLITKDIGYTTTDTNGKVVTSYGWAGAIAFGAMAVLLLPALYTMSASFPPVLQAKIQPVLDTIITVIGGFAALAGGGIGTFVMIPKLISSLQASSASIMAGGSEEPVQSGGGGVPSVQSVAESLLRGSTVQQGGGSSTDLESTVFMGILAVTLFGGLSLALARRGKGGLSSA